MEPTTTAAANAEQQAQSQFSRLPAALLARILQAVPQQKRLASCATVCTSWAAAAAAATVEFDLSDVHDKEAELVPAIQPWLDQHAEQLVSLRVDLKRLTPQLHLPCADLQQLSRLHLGGLDLQLGRAPLEDSSSTPGAAAMLPKLQDLRLNRCRVTTSTLLQLAQLSGVTSLKVAGLFGPSIPRPQNASEDLFDDVGWSLRLQAEDSQRRALGVAVKKLLQGLPSLTRLSLAQREPPTDIVQVLPADKLTALTLGARVGSLELPDSASRLSNLRKLKLQCAELNPVALTSMSLLTCLQLYDWDVLPGTAVSAGAAAFLAAVRGMQQLQHLSLAGVKNPWRKKSHPPVHPPDFAALTASSHLTHLEIAFSWHPPLPASALQHMFPAGKQLPQLQQLLLRNGGDMADDGDITTEDLCWVMRACPVLRSLQLTSVLSADADVSVLSQLPSTCVSLKVGEEPFNDRAAGVLAQLTQLTCLHWHWSEGVTFAGLQPLTTMQSLQTFCMEYAFYLDFAVLTGDNRFLGEDGQLELNAGEKPVSQQLRELLVTSTVS